MKTVITKLKKWVAFSAAVTTISALCTSVLLAQDSGTAPATTSAPAAPSAAPAGSSVGGGDISYYLQEIAQYTYGTLQDVNNLPTVLQSVAAMALAWLSPDTTNTTANLQSAFSTYTTESLGMAPTIATTQQQLLNNFFGANATTNIPYVNDLVFSTVLGAPLVTPDPRAQNQTGSNALNSAFNYIQNASSMNIIHTLPNGNWRGSQLAQQKYIAYYNTVSAVQTYNAYLMSEAYANYANGGQHTKTQLALIQQASNSDWFSQVATESIGVVLRQILMYSSQSYVLQSQLLDTQKQMLTAQAMTNTLLVLSNLSSETLLIKSASGEMPGG